MRARFYAVIEKNRETAVAERFVEGVRAAGDICDIADAAGFTEPEPGIDVVCSFGLKGATKTILNAYKMMGIRTLLFDKGFIRASTGLGGPMGYYRVSLDEFMPLERIARMMKEGVSAQRWIDTGLAPLARQERATASGVVFCGSSQKYCDYHGLGNEHTYAAEVIRKIRKRVGKSRLVYYRPKPSFMDARPIDGTVFSRPPTDLARVLLTCNVLVTHGSHSGIDAICAGVPAIILGDGAARPVCDTEFDALANGLRFPDQEERFRWLAALGWWQWRLDEMPAMWRFLRSEMERPV